MRNLGFRKSITRGFVQLARRPIYLIAMILIPIATALFLLSLMEDGLPSRVPAAVVDLDHTEMSRSVTRTLDAMQMVNVTMKLNSYSEAHDAMQRGEIFGYFIIPEGFAQKALSARQPEISYYSNLTYYVPGSLLFKGFKITSNLASGALIKNVLSGVGAPEYMIMPAIQPYSTHVHPIGNPWMSYAIYLGNSFIPCALALMILLVTSYSIAIEIKHKTSRQWLEDANGSMFMAVIGKLLPQTVIFFTVGLLIQAMLFGYSHFPLNCSIWYMILDMFLLVIACQSFALLVVSALPNLRIALSVCSLVGILSFSVAGFSFPTEQMYSWIDIFSYILPIRYYFLIYIDQALNGIPLFFSKTYYAALLVFPLISTSLLWNLKRACKNPVYIP
ncbi:MAG: ABC transporter permease [Muribaculaceae bacterium]|nr:ABC transporter permease [Muribaculaceae bacterium]